MRQADLVPHILIFECRRGIAIEDSTHSPRTPHSNGMIPSAFLNDDDDDDEEHQELDLKEKNMPCFQASRRGLDLDMGATTTYIFRLG